MIMSLTQGLVPFSLPSLVTVHGRSTRTGFLTFFHHPRASRFHALVTFLSIFQLTVQNANFFHGVSPRVARLRKSDTFQTCSSTSSRFPLLVYKHWADNLRRRSVCMLCCELFYGCCGSFSLRFPDLSLLVQDFVFLLSMEPRLTEPSPKVG